MTEPTVQVPVSLIEDELAYRVRTVASRVRMAEKHDEPYPRDWVENEIGAGRERIRALLSQPTPAAEEVRIECPRCKGYGVDPSVQQAGDKVIDCTRCGGDGEVAESPRIGDMAPGTTFMAATVQGYSSRWTVAVIGVLDATGMRYSIGYINPSTIRDVTPPKDAA